MMNTKTSKLVSPERAKDIIECYGADSSAWPADEKTSALSVIQHSSELQALLQETKQLDRLLDAGKLHETESEDTNKRLLSNIVNNLPEQEKHPKPEYRNTTQKQRQSFLNSNRWIGAIAASVAVFVISLSIVELSPVNVDPSNTKVAQLVLDEWMWEDVTGEAMTEEEDPLTMLALLELE